MPKLFCPFLQIPGNEGVVLRFSDCRWQLPQGHLHTRWEMNLVMKGRGEILLRDRVDPLLPGHMLWLAPGQWHSPLNWSDDLEMWIAEFDPPLVARARRGGPSGLLPEDPAAHFCRSVSGERMRELDHLLGSVENAILDYRVFNSGLLFALFALWTAFAEGAEVGKDRLLHPAIRRAIDLLNHPDTGELAVEDMARRVRMPSRQLSARFRAEVGRTIPSYRHQIRLQRFFERYEKEPSANLLYLALEAGFGSYVQFHRVFKQVMRKSPREWLMEK